MIYEIKQDIPGRLRVRCGSHLFDGGSCHGVAAYLRGIGGVSYAEVHAPNGSILVEYAPGDAVRASVLCAICSLDPCDLPRIAGDAESNMALENNRFAVELAGVVAVRFVKRYLLPAPLAAAVTLAESALYFVRGLRALLTGKVTVEVLDAVAIATAIVQREFTSAGNIMFLLHVSELMQDHVNARTRIALEDSLLVRADTVWVVRPDGTEVQMGLDEVRLGDCLHVRTGASLPVDGTVLEGEAEVNEATMTGESALVHKRPQSTVYGGTAVEDGSLVVRVDALPGSSRIDKIVAMVQESAELKADAQYRAEQLADRLVPFGLLAFVLALAVTRDLTRASAAVMVDYSCALKISLPVAVMSAMREASNDGAVVKGGKYLEALANADTVVFDKTGTLTKASPEVAKVICVPGETSEHVLTVAACLEEHFPHSIARAIVAHAKALGLHHEDEDHSEVEYVVAHGIASTVHGEAARIGSAHFIFEDEGVECPQGFEERLEREAPATGAVYLALAGKLCGAICIEDPLRPESASAIAALRARGIERVVMLTGGSEHCARAVANTLGIDECHAQVLPEDKAAYVDQLRAGGHHVVMVGDGINDSPALAKADVSVALNDASDIARTVADVTVLDSSLDSLVFLRDLSSALMHRISRDYRFIVGFNSVLIALGVAGVLAPTAAALAHNVSTVAVTALNATPLLPERAASNRKEEASDEDA